MKLILVPADTSQLLLKALEAAGVTAQGVGGFQIMATRLCPPDRCYVLEAKPLELVSPPEMTVWWDEIEEPPRLFDNMVFSMDYRYSGISFRPRPKPWWKRWPQALRDWWRWALADFKNTFGDRWS
jgi:hypothetical protein